jgi:hypothetical protein
LQIPELTAPVGGTGEAGIHPIIYVPFWSLLLVEPLLRLAAAAMKAVHGPRAASTG